MKTNVGNLDRILRIVAGLLLIALAATGTIGLGLDRYCSVDHRAAGVLPGVFVAGHQDLPDAAQVARARCPDRNI